MNTPLGFNASQDFQDCMMYGYWGYEHVHPTELVKIESERAWKNQFLTHDLHRSTASASAITKRRGYADENKAVL